jgi:hypothetical protein
MEFSITELLGVDDQHPDLSLFFRIEFPRRFIYVNSQWVPNRVQHVIEGCANPSLEEVQNKLGLAGGMTLADVSRIRSTLMDIDGSAEIYK